LSRIAACVGAVIGSRFNRVAGDAYLRQVTIARGAGVSVNTAKRAIAALEELGYLVIIRRDLGMRADGRRVAGGKGVANRYVPAFEGNRIGATSSTAPLAAAIERAWAYAVGDASPAASPVGPQSSPVVGSFDTAKQPSGGLLSHCECSPFDAAKEPRALGSLPIREPKEETRARANGSKPLSPSGQLTRSTDAAPASLRGDNCHPSERLLEDLL